MPPTIVTIKLNLRKPCGQQATKGSTQRSSTIEKAHTKQEIVSSIKPTHSLFPAAQHISQGIKGYIERYRIIPPKRPPSKRPRKNLHARRPLQRVNQRTRRLAKVETIPVAFNKTSTYLVSYCIDCRSLDLHIEINPQPIIRAGK